MAAAAVPEAAPMPVTTTLPAAMVPPPILASAALLRAAPLRVEIAVPVPAEPSTPAAPKEAAVFGELRYRPDCRGRHDNRLEAHVGCRLESSRHRLGLRLRAVSTSASTRALCGRRFALSSSRRAIVWSPRRSALIPEPAGRKCAPMHTRTHAHVMRMHMHMRTNHALFYKLAARSR